MEGSLYRIDAALAALADREVETRWRQALAAGEQEMIVVLARQLVLRGLPVIEQTCLLRAGLDRWECERAIEEASIKLLVRLLHDRSWSNLSALAAGIAAGCLDGPHRRREAIATVPVRPRLRLVADASTLPDHERRQERGDDHGCR